MLLKFYHLIYYELLVFVLPEFSSGENESIGISVIDDVEDVVILVELHSSKRSVS